MKITFLYGNDAKEYDCGEPETLLCAARHAGIPLDAPCGGDGRCGGCRVIARGALSAPDGVEREKLGADELARGVRLACRAFAVGDVTVTLTTRGDVAHDAEPVTERRRDVCSRRVGAAVDIGTTTLAASLVDMDTGKRIAETSAKNPQSAYGADVLSRISASENVGADELRRLVRDGVDALLRELGAPSCAPRVIVGNTVMLSLWAGVDPSPIGRAPFLPETLFGCDVDGAYIPRCVSGYFGADGTSAVLTAACEADGGDFVLADIGTNGEIAVMRGGVAETCAVPAGPALEGAGISCGMAAANGAIDAVTVSGGKVSCSVIGGGRAEGLCGSGLIDAISCLLMLGEIDGTGRLEHSFELADGVYITQEDVRAFQLAKGAVRAALETAVGDAAEDAPTLFLAGMFGSCLSVRSCVRTGLIPARLSRDVRVIGNGALRGAELILTDPEMRKKADEIAERAAYKELSLDPEFMSKYVRALDF